MRATGNLRVVQQMLGHARLEVTQVYCHPSSEDLAAAVAAISPEG